MILTQDLLTTLLSNLQHVKFYGNTKGNLNFSGLLVNLLWWVSGGSPFGLAQGLPGDNGYLVQLLQLIALLVIALHALAT